MLKKTKQEQDRGAGRAEGCSEGRLWGSSGALRLEGTGPNHTAIKRRNTSMYKSISMTSPVKFIF